MGGLVTKQMLAFALESNDPAVRAFAENMVGVVSQSHSVAWHFPR